jgi:hypothetical protein
MFPGPVLSCSQFLESPAGGGAQFGWLVLGELVSRSILLYTKDYGDTPQPSHQLLQPACVSVIRLSWCSVVGGRLKGGEKMLACWKAVGGRFSWNPTERRPQSEEALVQW